MKLTPWITATVLALGLTSAVQAQYQGYPSGQSYGQSYGYGRWDGQRTYSVAHQIDQTASWIYRQAARNRSQDRGEYRALTALYRLSAAASHFHGEVESYRQDPRHTANDFARLVAAYNQAVDSLRWIDQRPYVERGMDRIGEMLNELSPFYGRSYDRYQDRYDRDHRYDRDDNGYYRPPMNR